MPVNTIDSNITGLSYAEEETLKTLPTTPQWYRLEPNSYSDFGGKISTVERMPINPSRQRKKGVTTDLEASGGFNTDFTKNNLVKLLQGFFFADLREKFSTQPVNGTVIPITNVDAGLGEYQAASGLDGAVAGSLIKASGFARPENNIVFVADTATSGAISTVETLVAEVPTGGAKLEVVGHEFDAGVLTLNSVGADVYLENTTDDMTGFGLILGEWIFIGGNDTASTFDTAQGFARISEITSDRIYFDDVTFAPVTDAGASKTIQIYFGNVLKNENEPNLIKRRSYNMERTLGSDDDGIQSEYLVGAIPNEFKFNVPQTDKLNADLSFVAMDVEHRSGLIGVKAGDRNALFSEDAFNTSTDVFRLRMNVVDDLNVANSALFTYVTEMNITIKNNVTPSKAVGTLGSFDATAGNFEVDASLSAYFTTVSAVDAIRQNKDVNCNAIFTQDNSGFVLDMPLLSIAGGNLNVEKDAPIKVPLETKVAENKFGYTCLMNFFQHLPDAAMTQ